MNSLIGIWVFTAIIYQGQLAPLPNPNLHLQFTFLSASQNELFYFRDNERGFCRRSATYQLKDSYLHQEVTEVDPENNSSCAADTDMQLGKVSKTLYEIKDDKMYLHLSLGDNELQYVFTKRTEP
jgi:hypothetical protein